MDRTSGDTLSTINKKDSQKRAEEDIDRLSYLPDPILFLILSFLPFTQWILMRQVSKTFKNLWTHAPMLDFQAPKSRFPGHTTCPYCAAFHGHVLPSICYRYYLVYIEVQRERFCRLVSRTLFEHSGDTIKVFRLTLNYSQHPWDKFMLKRWVDLMFTKDIENIDVNFEESNSLMYYESTGLRVKWMCTQYLYYIPPQHFISNVLSVMSLQYCQLNATYFGIFASLKYLCLKNVALLDNKITNLLSKFPVLLSLVLEKCVFLNDFFVSDQVLTIKYLYIFDCFTTRWLTYKVDIITPQIKDFHFKGVGIQEFHIRNANELQSAQIDVNSLDASQQAKVRLSSLLNGLRHCSKLVLSGWCIQVLSRWRYGSSENLLPFHSVRNLELFVHFGKEELAGIYYLLECCSNLKTLTISIDVYHETVIVPELLAELYDLQENSFWETQDSAMTCVQYSVKTITIYGFSGKAREVEFLKFLLRNGQALENIYIQREEGHSMSNERWVSDIAHIYNDHIANAVEFASSRVQVVIK